MKKVIAAACVLLLLLFLIPLLIIRADPDSVDDSADGTLPLDKTVLTLPVAASDSAVSVNVKMEDGTVAALSLDKYLWRVVAAEMPASFEPEALKAQVVAARTYTLAKMGHTTENHPDADICTDVNCCQAYIDPTQASTNWGANAEENTLKIATAVADTDGMVIYYNGQPIQALFHSSSAGKTVDAVEVWGNDVPYLVSVDTPEGDEVPNYHSSVSVTPEEFKTRFLAEYPDAALDGSPDTWFAEPTLNSAGGVASITVGGVNVRGSVLRSLFSLRSTFFTVTATAQEITFSVTGYGHGVGMSQYGANTLAAQGKTWEDIIHWYYTDVTIEPMAGE
ncbi:MAG: stage II sporulation protein D [Oscillospiraceae bacterium]|nr:stage II sporulation protein D [Oscillospiraceae bacterium]